MAEKTAKSKKPGLFARLTGQTAPPTSADIAAEIEQLAAEQQAIDGEIATAEQQLVDDWGSEDQATHGPQLAALRTRRDAAAAAMQRLNGLREEARQRDLLAEFEQICREAVASREDNRQKQDALRTARAAYRAAEGAAAASQRQADALQGQVIDFKRDRGIRLDQATEEAMTAIRLRSGWIDETAYQGELAGIERGYKLAAGWRPALSERGYAIDAPEQA